MGLMAAFRRERKCAQWRLNDRFGPFVLIDTMGGKQSFAAPANYSGNPEESRR